MASSRKAPLLWISAGGTGGHMFPAQALAEEMLSRGWRVKLSTDERGARFVEGFPEDVRIKIVPSASPARASGLSRLLIPVRIFSGVLISLFSMLFQRPKLVAGFGGYPSIPALIAATILRIPKLIHEQNGVLGRVNRFFASRVHRFACGTWPTELPKGVKAEFTGNPVRQTVRERQAAPYIPPGDYPMLIVVLGGSQGARVLSEFIPAAIADLPAEQKQFIRVTHQARAEDIDAVAKIYHDAEISADIAPFFDDVPRLMSEAQLVICRSGASSVAELTVIGRPAILIPFAHATGDHQMANARPLEEAGAALVLQEDELSAEGLSYAISEILANPGQAEQMATTALNLAKPLAARSLADLAESLA